jgi:7,8-dihydropterin-6-yl-methyl-4-(beta-D-ribofuranosyl)aminobenzene 5'-phosphate synthase
MTVLFDNFWTDDRLQTGWGFAALLETPENTVLFDTGADGDILLENMRLMGIDPTTVEAVVISHAHGDHTGGLQALFDAGARPVQVLLSGFQDEMEGTASDSLPLVEATPGQMIVPGVFSTGQVDGPIREQGIFFESEDGLVVVTGCAHPGVVTMVERVRELRSEPLYQVMGGFHMVGAAGEDVEAAIVSFQRLGVQRAGPTHCSGIVAMNAFQRVYGENYVRLGVGRIMEFPLPSAEENTSAS